MEGRSLVILVACFFIAFFLYDLIFRKYSIQPSPIHGKGLFAKQTFQVGDIILDDLFPHKHPQRKLTDYVPDFENVIVHEGKFINHCSKKDNSDVISHDKKKFILVAKRFIPKGKEITANYDIVSRKFPFIASASEIPGNLIHC
jgi:hypothetical protein